MIFNMVGGGGGSGATLVVSSPANVSVTVSKDDKSYTKNSGYLGSTTFKGLATGTWTITISENGQNATKKIEITADYAITIAFFSATINITYPANSDCVVTNSSGQTVASDTNATSSEKTFTATVNATGTYTVTATATDGSGNTKSEIVEITSEGQSKSVELSYWHGELYYNGNQYVDITGGWIKYEDTITITFGASSITATGGVSGSINTSAIYTSKKVDLSAYNALRVTATNDSTNIAYAELRVTNSNSQPNESVVSYSNLGKGTNIETTLDVSSLSGEYYISIYFRNEIANFTITKIEML